MPAASCQAQYSRRLYPLGLRLGGIVKAYNTIYRAEKLKTQAPGIYIVGGKKVLVK